MSDSENTEKTSTHEAEPEKIWLVRNIESLCKCQMLLFFIIFMVAVCILNETLDTLALHHRLKREKIT